MYALTHPTINAAIITETVKDESAHCLISFLKDKWPYYPQLGDYPGLTVENGRIKEFNHVEDFFEKTDWSLHTAYRWK